MLQSVLCLMFSLIIHSYGVRCSMLMIVFAAGCGAHNGGLKVSSGGTSWDGIGG
jgi:hypothetical protein